MTTTNETQALTVRRDEPAALAFTDEEHRLILSSFMPGASEAEAKALIHVAEVMRLNPFKRQIHFVQRKAKNARTGAWEDRWAFQTSIDGYRSIAEDTGEYEGQDEPAFTFEETVNPATGEPTGKRELVARVAIYRRGFPRPFVGVARYGEYVQTVQGGAPNSMWQKMPRGQLAKCAESAGLRKAFPERLGSLYTDDEMPEERQAIGAGVAPLGAAHTAPAVKQAAPASATPAEDSKAAAEFVVALGAAASVAAGNKVVGEITARWPAKDNAHRRALAAIYIARNKAGWPVAAPAPVDAPAAPEVVDSEVVEHDPETGEVIAPADEPGSEG